MIQIRLAVPEDADQLVKLFHELWPDDSIEEHAAFLERLFKGTASSMPLDVFVADKDGELIGFIEMGLRSHADGCDTALPVGFIEGWYVAPAHRGSRLGAKLVEAAEQWAREKGCTEMASDTAIDNVDSQRAHQALGYEIVDRCVHFRKPL